MTEPKNHRAIQRLIRGSKWGVEVIRVLAAISFVVSVFTNKFGDSCTVSSTSNEQPIELSADNNEQ